MSKTSYQGLRARGHGRHAGWIAAAGGPTDATTEIPIVILFPSRIRPGSIPRQGGLAREEVGYCSVVVSEGVRSPDGKFLADQGLKDAFGHAQLGASRPWWPTSFAKVWSQVPLGRGGLSAARRSPYRIEDGRRAAYAMVGRVEWPWRARTPSMPTSSANPPSLCVDVRSGSLGVANVERSDAGGVHHGGRLWALPRPAGSIWPR